MGRSVFVDTSCWYALIDRRDALHERARSEVQALLGSGASLVTTDYVVDESCTLTLVRAGSHAARRLLDLLAETRAVEWEWVGADRFGRAESMFRRRADLGCSFTDCTSFVLMEELGIDAVLTSDRHFEQVGFRALLR